MNSNYLATLGVVTLITLNSVSASANPNPLLLPASPNSVRIQKTVPITLQQAFGLARHNNLSLQRSQLTLERSRAALREQQAGVYPVFGISAQTTFQRYNSLQNVNH